MTLWSEIVLTVPKKGFQMKNYVVVLLGDYASYIGTFSVQAESVEEAEQKALKESGEWSASVEAVIEGQLVHQSA